VIGAASGTFGPAGSMRMPRNDHTATLLSDEEVFIAGGFGGDYDEVLADTETYNLARASFTVGVPMAFPRIAHTATRLANGKILIVGGQSGVDILSSAELY
jgi:hypothetical protein